MFSEQIDPRWMCPSDRLINCDSELPVAAHIVTPRRRYTHHGIYVGDGRVVHYGGVLWGLRRGPVEEVSLRQFSQGHPIAHREKGLSRFEKDEVVRRARRRLGEDRYNVFTNNCEHFSEWCVQGEHRSYQVDAGLAYCLGFCGRLIDLALNLPAFAVSSHRTNDAIELPPRTLSTGVPLIDT
jgi:Lecithin retinol acyltransferase